MEETIQENPVQQQETKWYVLRVVSGKERKVKEYIENEVSRSGWNEIITQVLVPMEKIYKVKNGKKVRLVPATSSQKCSFPSRSSSSLPVALGNQW